MALDQFRIDDKVAIVSGGSQGIGRAIALGLAGAGANVALAARHLPGETVVITGGYKASRRLTQRTPPT